MSYIFSQALVEEYSLANYSDTVPCVPSSGSHTHKPCLWHDKTTEPSRLSQFGMTCKPLTENLGAELLTWLLAASRAQTFPQLVKAQESTAKPVECGDTWPASLAKYDHDSCTWKTAQYSLLGGLTEFSQTWPRWGLMRNGECWERQTLVPRTSGSASGFWQMPVADDAVNRAKGKINSRGEPKLSAQVLWTTPSASDATRGGTITDKMTGTSLVQQINTPTHWPTPCANSHTGAGHGPNKTGAPNLQTMVAMWSTPTVCGNYNRKGASDTSGDGLATAATQRTYPTATATATAYKGWSPDHNRADTDDRLDYTVEREAFSPGQPTPPMRLNPEWVEWLMGWPIGHTALKPLETAKFQEWQQQHGDF